MLNVIRLPEISEVPREVLRLGDYQGVAHSIVK